MPIIHDCFSSRFMRHPITSPIAVSNAVNRFQNVGEKREEGERKWKNQPLCSCARSVA